MMERNSVLREFEAILADVLDEEVTLEEDTAPKSIPHWDSLVQMTFMLIVEKTFGVELSMKEISEFTCIGQLIDDIEAKKEAQS